MFALLSHFVLNFTCVQQVIVVMPSDGGNCQYCDIRCSQPHWRQGGITPLKKGSYLVADRNLYHLTRDAVSSWNPSLTNWQKCQFLANRFASNPFAFACNGFIYAFECYGMGSAYVVSYSVTDDKWKKAGYINVPGNLEANVMAGDDLREWKAVSGHVNEATSTAFVLFKCLYGRIYTHRVTHNLVELHLEHGLVQQVKALSFLDFPEGHTLFQGKDGSLYSCDITPGVPDANRRVSNLSGDRWNAVEKVTVSRCGEWVTMGIGEDLMTSLGQYVMKGLVKFQSIDILPSLKFPICSAFQLPISAVL